MSKRPVRRAGAEPGTVDARGAANLRPIGLAMLEADALTLQLDQALQVVGSAGKTAGHLAGEIADIMVLPPRNERRALPEDAFPAEQPADVCGDMERELAALETRLTFFQSLRELQLHPPDVFAAPKPANAEVVVTPSPPRPHSQSSQQQQAGQVADEVESALRTCDQLLHRARSIATAVPSRAVTPASVSSRSVSAESVSSRRRTAFDRRDSGDGISSALSASSGMTSDRLSSYVPVTETASLSPIDSDQDEAECVSTRSGHSRRGDGADILAGSAGVSLSTEEWLLQQKTQAVRELAASSHREMEREMAAVRQQQQETLATYLSELQRKYESKKKMALLSLREKSERETKAAVRRGMEQCEKDQDEAVATMQASILQDRERLLQEIKTKHESATADLVRRLDTKMSAETLEKKETLEKQLQAEQERRLSELETKQRDEFVDWERSKRLTLEQELFNRRERAATLALKEQEARTHELIRELESTHCENEQQEVQKLKKALAFGAQAQLQQVRRRLQTQQDEQLADIRMQAALDLEKKTDELTRLLTTSHRAQRQQLERELETKQRVAILELQDSMQRGHQEEVEAMKRQSDEDRAAAVEAHRSELATVSRKELDDLRATLAREMHAKVYQMELEQDAECEQALERLRVQIVQNHAKELDAKLSRVHQSKAVLLAEANTFLNLDKCGEDDDRSGVKNGAVANLERLKKHLSKELVQYVSVVVDEFEDQCEEQRILVAKITEATQLYLSFKRQCRTLEEQTAELKQDVKRLEDETQRKELVCKKLYHANEALMKRLQLAPLASGSPSTSRIVPPSPAGSNQSKGQHRRSAVKQTPPQA